MRAILGQRRNCPKRDWTYRQVLWLADKLGVPMRMPISHPFNPLQFLRLSLACRARVGETNRYVCELIFKHVWTSGADMNDSACFETLLALLKPQHDVQGSDVKTRLKVNTEAAIGAGVIASAGIVVIGIGCGA